MKQSLSKKRIRIAATLFFIAQGLTFASWASRLPDISHKFHVLDLLDYGALMFMLPIGKFLAIPIVGFLFPRLGSKKTVLISIVSFILILQLISIIPINFFLLGALILLFGTAWNMTDIALNTQAIEVEKLYGKPIIATFHASWSLAAVIGALIGYMMYNFNISIELHFGIIIILSLVLVLTNYKFLPDVNENIVNTELKKDKDEVKDIWYLIKHKIKPESLLLSLGVVWLCVLIVENTMFEWGDMYYQKVIDVPARLRIGFLIFMLMMFVGRMVTSFLYSILSKAQVLKIAGLFIFVGFTICGFLIENFDNITMKVVIASIGFVMIGLGTSCIVPTIYSIVAEKAKTPTGIALTIMSSISFIGPLLQPVMVAGIAHKINLQWAYFSVGLVGLIIFLIVVFNKSLKE